MEAKVIQRLFPELISAIGSCVQNASDHCFSQSLIGDATHRKVLESAGTDQDKARILMSAVRENVARDHTCFQKFITVLENILPQGVGDPLLKKIKEVAMASNVHEVGADELQIPPPRKTTQMVLAEYDTFDSTASNHAFQLQRTSLPSISEVGSPHEEHHHDLGTFMTSVASVVNDNNMALKAISSESHCQLVDPDTVTVSVDDHKELTDTFQSTKGTQTEHTKSNIESSDSTSKSKSGDGVVEDLKHVMRVDLKKIRQRFFNLQSEVRESLRKVPLEELITHILGYVEVFDPESDKKVQLLPEENLRCATSTDHLFTKCLQKQWNFLEYDMLISVVEKFGDEIIRKKVEEYHSYLKEFFEKRKLSEVPKDLSLSNPVDETHEPVVMKLDLNDPTLKVIKDRKSVICEILEIMPSTLLISEIKPGCVEITFLIPVHISKYVFGKPITDVQREALKAASVLKFTWRNKTEILFAERKYLDDIHEYHDDSSAHFGSIPKKGVDYEKEEEKSESDNESTDDTEKAYYRVTRVQEIEDAYCEISCAESEILISSKKSLLKASETMASQFLAKNYKTMDIIEEYIKALKRRKEDYFRLEPAHSEMLDEDSDEERDSDYESELASVIDIEFESGDDSNCNRSDSQLHDTPMTRTAQHCQSSTKHPDPDPDQQQEWEVECTPRVLKKLKYKKTPEHLRKAVCTTIFHDLARGRHWHPVKTQNKKHQLFQKKVLRGKAAILWERVIQFSAKLTDVNIYDPIYTDVVRVWDIVLNERSYQQSVKSIESSWNRQRHLSDSTSEEYDLHDVESSQTTRVTHKVLASKDFEVVPPADPDPNQYKPLILHEVPHDIEVLLSFSRKFDLPIKLWPEEYKITHMNLTKPLVVLGRSGTGKTTCCLYRMVQEFLISTQSDNPPLRQLFVTKNKHLRKKFKDQFFRLITHHSLPNNAIVDSTMTKVYRLHDLHCPVFMTSEELFYMLDHSLHHDDKDLTHCCNTDLGCHSTSDTQSAIKEVNSSYFVNKIWKLIGKKNQLKKTFNPQLVWMEFMTFIKGYGESQLSKEEYCELSSRVAPNFTDPRSREEIYRLFEEYSHYCRSRKIEKLFDKCDMVLHLYHKLLKLKGFDRVKIPWLFDSLYVDEVQDFTQSEILLLLQCHKNPKCNVFLTGDTAQTVMKDVSFRFKDLKALFYNIKFLPNEAPLNYLQVNYRSHTGILDLAKSVLDIIKRYHPDSIDVVPSDKALFHGPKPKFIKQCDEDTLMRILASNVRNPSDIQFGHHQAVIVRNNNSEQDLPIKNALVFSIYESKGLEFDDVLLYNFFEDSENKECWKKDFKDLPNIELKHLYTAITRAKGNLWIYEAAANQESKLPILREWINSSEGLVELVDPNDQYFMPVISFATAKTSTPKQWKLQGDVLRQEGKWRQASFCYQRADRPDLQTETEAEGLEAQQDSNCLEVALAYLKADEINHNAKFIEKVAKNLLQARKVLHAAWLYKTLSNIEGAIQAYKRGKHYMEASDLYEEHKKYLDSIQVLVDHKWYVEAAAKAKKLENSGMSLSDDISSISIAKKHIKKYCKPEWEREAEMSTFYGLLDYIPDKEEKVVFIKHAKRFKEALEIHFESQEHSKFYRLAIAQGPHFIASSAVTFYDCALYLSSVCGHFAMHKTLVISSARSHTKSSSSLIPPRLLNELENLSQPNFVDVATRLNALLLLAKYDESRIQEAVNVCNLYHCLPFDVELGLLQLEDEKVPLSHFIQSAYKIHYLLSLNSHGLLAAYKELLGIHRSKSDEMYLKQECYAEELGHEFVSDCYLLPHECQDIWIQTLTRSKRVTRDIDGMWVIPTKVLFTEIRTHLKRALETLLIHCFKSKTLLEYPLKKFIEGEIVVPQFMLHPNPMATSYYLEIHHLVLHSTHHTDSKILEEYKNDSTKMLRQYHSIEMSCYFPLCVNYISWKERMGKRAWNLFQSQTKKWIDSHVTETANFDFLRLWEQASITKLTQTLKGNLDRLIETGTRHKLFDDEALNCYRTTLKWIEVCNQVIKNPLQGCRTFFSDCLPRCIALNFDLRSVVDSVSIYGTIVLALISCIAPSPDRSIVVPHMYSRALSVYDSLLPKDPWQNVLNSCCNKVLSIAKSKLSSTRRVLVQCLNSALRQIESLLLNESLSRYSDLPRLTVILMLTLYMNYAMLEPTSSEISRFHSRFVRCFALNKQNLTYLLGKEKASQINMRLAFHEAGTVSNLLSLLKHLLRPSMENRYEALTIITFSKNHRKIYIEPNEDITLPCITLGSKVKIQIDLDKFMQTTPLLPEHTREQFLYFRLPRYKEVYPLWTTPSSCPVWMYYNECGEEVMLCLKEFVSIVLVNNPSSSIQSIEGKSLLQQLLNLPEADITQCLDRLHNPQPGWINKSLQ